MFDRFGTFVQVGYTAAFAFAWLPRGWGFWRFVAAVPAGMVATALTAALVAGFLSLLERRRGPGSPPDAPPPSSPPPPSTSPEG